MSLTIVDRSRSALAQAVRNRIAGPDFQEVHERIWNAPGERWFTPDDAIWKVHADTSMFIGGMRALLLQSLHPVAMFGVSEKSAFRSDPWGRLQRTSTFLATTTYGTVADAERSINIVRAVHKRIQGTTPGGTPYRASDPHLLGWIHAAEVDSFLASYHAFGGDRLTAGECDDYVAQSGWVAAKLGVIDPPGTVAELRTCMAAYRPELMISASAEETAELLLKDPPISGPARVGYGLIAAGAVSILPRWAQSELGLDRRVAREKFLARPLAGSALSVIRWGLAGVGSV